MDYKEEIEPLSVEPTRRIAWTQAQDDIIIDMMVKAKENNITFDAAYIAASEMIAEKENIERSVTAVEARYYHLKRNEKLPPILLGPDKLKEEGEGDELATDLAGIFVEMRKIIRERDELKVKYENILGYKVQYEAMKKKLEKIEKESAAFMDLLRKKA